MKTETIKQNLTEEEKAERLANSNRVPTSKRVKTLREKLFSNSFKIETVKKIRARWVYFLEEIERYTEFEDRIRNSQQGESIFAEISAGKANPETPAELTFACYILSLTEVEEDKFECVLNYRGALMPNDKDWSKLRTDIKEKDILTPEEIKEVRGTIHEKAFETIKAIRDEARI